MFIVFEGGDGTGKHTQTEMLAARGRTVDFNVYSFPRYDTPIGKAISAHLHGRVALTEERTRDSSDMRVDGDSYYVRSEYDPLAFQALMLMDRYDAAPSINEARRRGGFIVSDRYWESALVYGTVDGLDRDMLIRSHSSLPQADVAFLLDLPPEVAAARRGKPRDRHERDAPKMLAVRAAYLKFWEEMGRAYAAGKTTTRYFVIDSTPSADEVHEKIWQTILSPPPPLPLPRIPL